MTTPRLIKWANDGYPPIDLNNELGAVIELIKAFKELESKQLHKPDVMESVCPNCGDTGRGKPTLGEPDGELCYCMGQTAP